MTISKLIKELQKIQKKSPRAEVFAEWETFSSPDYTHGLLNSVHTDFLPMKDGDGGNAYDSRGREKMKHMVVLSGH